MSDSLKRVAIVGAHHEESLRCMAEVCAIHNDVEFVLYGDKGRIENLLSRIDIKRKCWSIVDVADHSACCEMASVDAMNNRVNVLMKGSVKTSEFIKAILDKKHILLSEGALLSHVARIELPWYPKPILLTDAALAINPNIDRKIAIIENVVQVAHKLNIATPKVALICPVEVVNPNIVSTTDAAQIVFLQRSTGKFKEAIVEGPFALDVALSSQAASVKQIPGSVPGDADILMMPNLDSANTTLKAFTLTPGVKYGGIVVGAKVPIILTSRSDLAEHRIKSLDLALSL